MRIDGFYICKVFEDQFYTYRFFSDGVLLRWVLDKRNHYPQHLRIQEIEDELERLERTSPRVAGTYKIDGIKLKFSLKSFFEDRQDWREIGTGDIINKEVISIKLINSQMSNPLETLMQFVPTFDVNAVYNILYR